MAIRFYPGPSGQSFDLESPQGAPSVSNPLQGLDDEHLVITQLYMGRASTYKRPPDNDRMPLAIHPALAYFCGDSDREPAGIADIVTWTRTWATLPLGYSLPRSVSITFPGFVYDATGSSIDSTEFTQVVAAKLDVAFFLVGAGGSYSSQFGIPVLDAESYTSPSGTSPVITKPLFGGGLFLKGGYSGSASAWSTPSQKSYRDRIAYDAANGGYSSRAETSQLEHYLGNIWMRSTLQHRSL